ncbi:hypothetical protein [Nocardioides houyundeii]|uniref:hypothetical protein n=1 Tax=Nocardioides houyundeii TaxID=2045452 RepID=UPI000C77F226|nr:hypothetical protein [Nocardioides houyundeii]
MYDLYTHPAVARNALRRLASTAESFAVELPGEVADAFTAEPVMPLGLAEAQATAALAISESVTLSPAKRAEITTDALNELARAEAASKIRGRVSDMVATAHVATVEAHADEILARFRVALADDVNTLNERASQIPLVIRDIASMDTRIFESYSLARTAAGRVDEVLAAVSPFAPTPGDRGNLPIVDWRRLGLLDVDDCDVKEIVWALREMKPSEVPGSIATITAPWHVLAARAGARFVLADGATRRANAEHMAAGRVVTCEATQKRRRLF